jgi:hypothetical protein
MKRLSVMTIWCLVILTMCSKKDPVQLTVKELDTATNQIMNLTIRLQRTVDEKESIAIVREYTSVLNQTRLTLNDIEKSNTGFSMHSSPQLLPYSERFNSAAKAFRFCMPPILMKNSTSIELRKSVSEMELAERMNLVR